MFSLKAVSLLLVLGILFYAGLGIFQFNFIIFLKDIYKWGPTFIGAMLTLVGVFDVATRALLLPRLLKHFSEESIGIAGLTGLGIGLIFIVVSSLIPSVTFIALAIIFIITGAGLFEPTYNGRLSLSIDETRQGKLQGVNQSLQSLNNMLIPLLAAVIYFYSPPVLYGIAALVVAAAVVFYANFIPKYDLHKSKT